MIIPIEKESIQEYHNLIDAIFSSGFLSEGNQLKSFEESFSNFCGIESLAVCNGGAALSAIYDYIGVQGKDVIVPANTFWATTATAIKQGANIVYADSNKNDLCISLEDIKNKITSNTKAIVVTHIGGHIAFEIEEIAAFCKEQGIFLVEDCAHAHGATYNGKSAGSWGLAGAYSFYATKTLPLGEGGMVVSKNKEFMEWLKAYRNYGKHVKDGVVSYPIKNGLNYRMSEMVAAFGVVQMKRLEKIINWKKDLAFKYDQIFKNRIQFPTGMTSGFYKYIVFDEPHLKLQTGKVFNNTDFGNEIQGIKLDLPNSYWIAEHHKCPPIWYGWEHSGLSVDELTKVLFK